MGEDIETFQKIMEKAEGDGSTYREPGKDSMNVAIRQDDERNGFFIASTFLEEVSILPSTKLTAAMAVVLTWMDEAPDDKILSKSLKAEIRCEVVSVDVGLLTLCSVFTQFTGTAKMLGFMLQTLKIGFRYYYGGLASPQKDQALKAIREDDGIKILVRILFIHTA